MLDSFYKLLDSTPTLFVWVALSFGDWKFESGKRESRWAALSFGDWKFESRKKESRWAALLNLKTE